MEIKSKINKWDLIKLKKLLHKEGNYMQGEKTAFRMGENNSKWRNWQINLKNIQETPEAQFHKINDPIKKWAKELNRQFSKEDIHMANKHIKRFSTSVIIREMQIETNEVPSHASQNGCYPNIYKQ